MLKKINSLEEYFTEYKKSISDPEKFWEEQANSFCWQKKWEKVLNWDFEKPEIKWFEGGKLNITNNCLDRHLKSKNKKTAIKWIPNNPKEKTIDITYEELHLKVCKYINMMYKGLFDLSFSSYLSSFVSVVYP